MRQNGEKFMRKSGILMHISSLPSKYGIGKMGKSAYDFVDFLVSAGVKCWQILPLSPTSYGDSPYQSFSVYAGNPYFIDFETLKREGLIKKSDYEDIKWQDNDHQVNYSIIYNNCFKVLRQAYKTYKRDISKRYKTFVEKNSSWLDDYALFMALKFRNNGKPWYEWDKKLAMRDNNALKKASEELEKETEFFKFIQYKFFRQWSNLKKYANDKGVEIIGDMPIYVSYDSVEAWVFPELFQFDKHKKPKDVAGCPPDDFAVTGQLWGNPLYDWDKMEADGFLWWRKRMKNSARLYDVIRIDHFLGIIKYYTIPYDMPDAIQGSYEQGPGQKLLDAINESIGDKKIIAEDLGVEVPEVAKILKENGYPGMKVLEFAFGGDRKNPHLPYNYTQNLVCYGGTHDNETLLGFFEDRGDWELGYAYDYLDTRDKGRMVDQVFRAAYSSVAVLTVFAVQDILKLGNWARMNLPSSMGNNWKWRMQKGQLGQHELECMRYLASVFDRERK